MELRCKKIEIDDLLKDRPNVLASWKTGADATDLEKSFARQRDIPESRRLSSELSRAGDADGLYRFRLFWERTLV